MRIPISFWVKLWAHLVLAWAEYDNSLYFKHVKGRNEKPMIMLKVKNGLLMKKTYLQKTD